MLKVKDLSLYQGGKPLCESLSFTMKESDFFALKGGTPFARSTLLETLTGYYRDYKGEIRIEGHDPKVETPDRFRVQIGFYLHRSFTYPNLSICQNIEQFRHYNIPHTTAATDYLELAFGFHWNYHRPIKYLPPSMRNKLELFIALIKMPQFMFLDEPLEGLNEDEAAALAEYIQDDRRCSTAYMVCSDNDDWLKNLANKTLTL